MKPGYNKRAKYLTILFGSVILAIALFLIFEDQLFTGYEAKKLVEEQNIQLHDEYMLLDNSSSSAMGGDYPPDFDAIYRHENRILSDEDLANWHRDGYILVKDIVPRSQCEAASAAIWEYLDASPDDPATWYKDHPGKNGMMLRLVHHPALDANRFSSRIRKVFEELYGHDDIYQPIDKVSFNAPESGTHKFTGSPLHWDVSVAPPIPYSAQGLLYLTDTTAADGAFNCVPGFHNIATEWLSETGPGVKPRERAINELKPIPVPGNAGDMVIWLQALPHCATPNKGTMPRMVQYISWRPKDIKVADEWI